MKELVKIVEKEGKQVVEGRDLHFALGVKSNYRDWITNRIKDYGFEEGEDYTMISFAKNLAKPHSGRPETNHLITLDMAKELAMVERSNMGRMIRKYFIEVEKVATAVLPTAGLVYDNKAYKPYITWLLMNGYSVLNARKRMTKHKTHFVKVNETWYISEVLAGALNELRITKLRITELSETQATGFEMPPPPCEYTVIVCKRAGQTELLF